MKRHGFLLPAAFGAAVIGFFLRLTQLKTAFHAGLPEGIGWIYLAVWSAAVVVAAVLCVRSLPETAEYDAIYQSSPIDTVLSVGASGLILAANISAFLTVSGANAVELLLNRIDAALGVALALSIIAAAASRLRKTKPGAWTTLVPTAFLLLNLVLDFRRWSVDPIVLDYCYKLFFSISAMFAVYNCGGFLFDKGKRRVSAAWCLIGIYFAGVTLADGGLQHCLLTGGLLLLLALNTMHLLLKSE